MRPYMVLKQPVKPFQEQLLNSSTRGVNSVNIFDILKFLEFGRNREYMQFWLRKPCFLLFL